MEGGRTSSAHTLLFDFQSSFALIFTLLVGLLKLQAPLCDLTLKLLQSERKRSRSEWPSQGAVCRPYSETLLAFESGSLILLTLRQNGAARARAFAHGSEPANHTDRETVKLKITNSHNHITVFRFAGSFLVTQLKSWRSWACPVRS